MVSETTRYVAKPIHIYTLCLPLLLLGAVAVGWGVSALFWLGIFMMAAGIGVGIWVVLAGILQAKADYLNELSYNSRVIAQNMTTMAKVKDPNVWAVLGYEMPVPEPARIEHSPAAPKSLPRLAFPTPPATVPQMKLLANDVLRGGSMSEGKWAGPDKAFSGPAYRKLMHWGEHPDRKYWRYINPTYPKKGRALTRDGTEFLLFYADEELKQLFSQQGRPVEGIEMSKEMIDG